MIDTEDKKYLYFLSYIKGNKSSVMKFYNKLRHCKIVNNVNDIPNNEVLCISGHYNSYKLLELLQLHNDYEILKSRINENTLKYIGICSGLQILLDKIKDEFSDNIINGLNIIQDVTIIKRKNPSIGFINDKFYCHSFNLYNAKGEIINEYIKKNVIAYQYHPENSNYPNIDIFL